MTKKGKNNVRTFDHGHHNGRRRRHRRFRAPALFDIRRGLRGNRLLQSHDRILMLPFWFFWLPIMTCWTDAISLSKSLACPQLGPCFRGWDPLWGGGSLTGGAGSRVIRQNENPARALRAKHPSRRHRQFLARASRSCAAGRHYQFA